ncbi:hypothetical protein [Nonomuraea turcica]|uniref:hypothetical protein n=1 Tax=Nonomuraea sp. G32 TaxID=3067274 RepID=UPI00273BC99B|nr:hypothetical protein [Nonomuraea sp. G32]MDP4511964.1 hypothetical protein [Nonomuraea sp. G32]
MLTWPTTFPHAFLPLHDVSSRPPTMAVSVPPKMDVRFSVLGAVRQLPRLYAGPTFVASSPGP